MKHVYHSILFSALDRYGSLLFFLVSTGILARLLTPREFGIYAVVNALATIVATSFQEFGGANYLIQKPSLSQQNIRTAFTIVFAISAAFTVMLFVLRDLIADFFSQQGMQLALSVSCLNFLLSPFSLTIAALLRRDLSFAALTRCNLAGNFVTAVTSIGLAVLGYSFMAPVIGVLAGNSVITAMLLATKRDLRIFRPSLAGYKEVLHFGTYSSAVAFVNILYNLAPQLILARVLDFTVVGLYSRATSMTQVFDRLFLQVMSPVIGPAIFAHARAGGDLKRVYLRSIELLTSLQWPFLTFLALLANPIILIWLGSAWSETVPLVRMLCIASLSLFAACLTYPTLVAVGRIKDSLLASLLSLPPSLAAIFVASFFGVNAVAASALVALPLQAAVANYFVGRQIGMKPIDLFNALLKSGIVTVFSTTGAMIGLALSKYGPSGPAAELLISGMCAAAAWGGGLILTAHPVVDHIRSLLGGWGLGDRVVHTN
jgi:O-antigen/teichoic acid export membrane protein